MKAILHIDIGYSDRNFHEDEGGCRHTYALPSELQN